MLYSINNYEYAKEAFDMNKQPDNKLALSVVATLTAGIALIYILIAYPRLIFAVAGVSAIFLICAYILTQNIVNYVNMKNKSLNVQIKNGMDDISSQIESMSSAQAQLGKATYLYTRQAAEKVAALSGNYADSQEALHKNLSVLANAQNKSTKLLIKYDQNNTTKLISTLKDIKNHLSETVSQGFDPRTPSWRRGARRRILRRSAGIRRRNTSPTSFRNGSA